MNRASHRLGLDGQGVLHVQTFMEAGPDLNFVWRTGFVLFKDKAGALRWGIWDDARVLVSVEPKAALPFVNSLLKHCRYIADTVLPKVVEGDVPGSFMTVLPSEVRQEVKLTEADIYTLGEQRDVLDDWVNGGTE